MLCYVPNSTAAQDRRSFKLHFRLSTKLTAVQRSFRLHFMLSTKLYGDTGQTDPQATIKVRLSTKLQFTLGYVPNSTAAQDTRSFKLHFR